ncbi:hypothetical protein D3C77_621170 [compost metagenome]
MNDGAVLPGNKYATADHQRHLIKFGGAYNMAQGDSITALADRQLELIECAGLVAALKKTIYQGLQVTVHVPNAGGLQQMTRASNFMLFAFIQAHDQAL